MLLDAAEQLVGFQLVFAGTRTPQQAHVKHHDVAPPGLHAIQHISQVVQIEVIADRHKNVSGARAHRLGAQFALQFQVELVHFDVGYAAMLAAPLGKGEDDIQHDREGAAGHGGDGLGEQVGDGNQEQRQRDQAQAHGDLHAADREVERHLEFALAGIGVTQHQHRQAIHRETPDDPEGVKVGEKGDVAAADHDGGDLQQHDNVDDAVAGAESGVRLTEPLAHHAVFGNAVQHAIRAHDRGVHRPSKNQRAHHNHESMEDQARDERTLEAHRQPADQILQKALANVVGNDHHREEGNQRSENQAVNENDQTGLLEVQQLGAFDFAVHLRERFLAAHGQHGVSERDENRDDAEHVRQAAVRQPSKRAAGEVDVAGIRKWRQRRMAQECGVNAPADQDHHHHGDQPHDVQRFFAGLGNALGIFPPEINGDDNGETRGDSAHRVGRKSAAQVKVLRQFAEQSGKILAGGHAADRPG